MKAATLALVAAGSVSIATAVGSGSGENEAMQESRAYLHSYNLPSDALALHRYCPVAYFAVDEAILGSPEFASDHDGLVLYLLKDEDRDGVPDSTDVCLGTEIPEGVPTSGSLGVNRWALVDGDGVFDTTPPPGGGGGPGLRSHRTAGCRSYPSGPCWRR